MEKKIKITKEINFCCGHRITEHEGHCKNIHGHNYKLIVTISPKTEYFLDEKGRVIDFSEIKKLVKNWIDEKWDHAFIAYEKDEKIIKNLNSLNLDGFAQKIYIMDTNVTAENMALHLLGIFNVLFMDLNVYVSKVELFETPTSSAIAYWE
jgi:6-pyruvoyltetrahydropterin/6-carboxytetrahydropterin synthase